MCHVVGLFSPFGLVLLAWPSVGVALDFLGLPLHFGLWTLDSIPISILVGCHTGTTEPPIRTVIIPKLDWSSASSSSSSSFFFIISPLEQPGLL